MSELSKICDKLSIDKELNINYRVELAIKLDPFSFFKHCEKSYSYSSLFNHNQSVLIFSYFCQHFNQFHIPFMKSIVKSVSYKFFKEKFDIFATFLRFDLDKEQQQFLIETYFHFFSTHLHTQRDFLQQNLSTLPKNFQDEFFILFKKNTKDKKLIEEMELFLNISNF